MAVGLTSCTVTPADPSTGKYATQYPQTTLEYSIYINKQITGVMIYALGIYSDCF